MQTHFKGRIEGGSKLQTQFLAQVVGSIYTSTYIQATQTDLSQGDYNTNVKLDSNSYCIHSYKGENALFQSTKKGAEGIGLGHAYNRSELGASPLSVI